MTAIADHLRSLLALRTPPPMMATLCYVKWTKTQAISAQVEVRVDERRLSDVDDAYPDIAFHRQTISGPDLVDAILSRLDQVLGQMKGFQVDNRRPAAGGEWPATSLDLRYDGTTRAGQIRDDALLAFGVRPQMRARDAIAAWFGGEPPDLGTCRVLVEDPRGRIESVVREGSRLRVVAGRHSGQGGLEVHVVMLSEHNGQLAGERDTVGPDGTCFFLPPPGATTAEIFLLNQLDEVLDRRREALAWAPLSDDALRDRGAQATHDLANGEREEVEFKPWTKDDDPKKRAEIIKTMVAFGNESRACRLYLGVTDEGEPEGDGPMHVALKTILTNDNGLAPEDRLRRWLKKLLDTQLISPPRVDARLLHVAGAPVLSVLVEPSASGPCATQDHRIWVRRGATSKRPELEHLRQLFRNDETAIRPYLDFTGG